MTKDGRYVTIIENGKVSLMMFFSVCDDPEPYLNNIDHEYIPHDPSGKILVIEDMVTTKFKFKYVSAIQDSFCNKFPHLEKAMWRRRRYPNDKIYTLWKRGSYAKSH